MSNYLNLYISDQEYGEGSREYESVAEQVQEELDLFVRTLREIVEESALAGSIADKLLAFADMTEYLLAQELGAHGIEQSVMMGCYIEEIDIADGALY